VSRAGLLAACAAVCAAAAGLVGWQTESATTAIASGPLDGAGLFRSKGCAACHNARGSNAQYVDFPSLVDAPSWAGDRRPGLSAEDYVAESIRAPSIFISPAFVSTGGPTEGMPDLGLTAAEIDALVDFVLQG
jgi:mono/diheme cytochrome c family protein